MEESSSKMQVANMNEIIESTKEKPILSTHSLASCHGVILYDPENKKAILGHVSSNYMESLNEMILRLKPNKESFYEYAIIPGSFRLKMKDNGALKEMENYILHYDNNSYSFLPMNIKIDDVINIDKDTDSISIAFDATNGKFIPITLKDIKEELMGDYNEEHYQKN